jgi:hypothetical protein
VEDEIGLDFGHGLSGLVAIGEVNGEPVKTGEVKAVGGVAGVAVKLPTGVVGQIGEQVLTDEAACSRYESFLICGLRIADLSTRMIQ